MDFYERVKRLARETKNLSLQEFIISLDMNHDSYYSLKRAGNLPRADDALKIAQALGVTVEYLITGQEAAKPDTADALHKLEDVAAFLKKL